jgi:hypothetical protein
MTKATKNQIAAQLASDMLDADVSDVVVAAVAKSPKAEVVAKVQSDIEAAVALTIRELAVLKAVAASEFVDPVTGSVPSFTLAVESNVEAGKGKVNSPIPGIVASLSKKGLFETIKVKGQTMINISKLGTEFLEAAK